MFGFTEASRTVGHAHSTGEEDGRGEKADRLVPVAPGASLTVLIPAYNEAGSVGDTIRSLQVQTRLPEQIIVIDDCSSDNTSEVALALGVTVLRPPKNTGSKAGAQNYAMNFVQTELCMAIDGDTSLAPNAIERILRAVEGTTVAAACGFVIPRHVTTLWERGRYIEYLFAFTFFKQIQDYYEKPLISSGCFSVYRCDVLRKMGGWSLRTMAEDMDLTWSLYEHGYRVRFVADAVCYPIEPPDYHFMSKQLRRWSHGFIQNVRLHYRGLLHVPFLGSAVAVALWDGVVASFAFLILLPLLAIFVNPLFLLGYAIDIPAVAVPVLVAACRRNEVRRALVSLPSFLVLRVVNSFFMLRAAWMELVLNRSLLVYEKGH